MRESRALQGSPQGHRVSLGNSFLSAELAPRDPLPAGDSPAWMTFLEDSGWTGILAAHGPNVAGKVFSVKVMRHKNGIYFSVENFGRPGRIPVFPLKSRSDNAWLRHLTMV